MYTLAASKNLWLQTGRSNNTERVETLAFTLVYSCLCLDSSFDQYGNRVKLHTIQDTFLKTE